MFSYNFIEMLSFPPSLDFLPILQNSAHLVPLLLLLLF